MQISTKELPQGEIELNIEVPWNDLKPFLEQAAIHLSEHTTIPGFRPGKASYDVVKQRFGEMKILDGAMETIVKKTFTDAVSEKKLKTIGMPEIQVKAAAPGNTLIYTAKVGLLPGVTIPDWKAIRVQEEARPIRDEDVTVVIDDVRKMAAKEVITDAPAGATDKIVVDIDISIDNIPVEGGQARDHGIYLNEAYYIPGLPEQLIGLKKGDEKKINLKFPDKHYQKALAGKEATFSVKIKDVYERTLPEADDALAQTLGQKTISDMRELIRKNLEWETKQKSTQAAEAKILDTMIAQTKFGELPPVLIEAEKRKMFEELKETITGQGGTIEGYLAQLKKSREEIFSDFDKQSRERVKAALVLRALADAEQVSVAPTELDEEVSRVRELYKNRPDIDERLKDAGVRNYIETMLLHRKVMLMIKESAIEKSAGKFT